MNLLVIENKAGKVRLNESVSPDSMERLLGEISKVFGAKAAAEGKVTGEITNYIENAADTLDIEIHSPGGSVLDGYKLYHAILELRNRGVFVRATINSLAASMASVIAMAADEIVMVKGGRMMIHEASQAVWGNAEDLARAAKVLDEISEEIADIYASRTGAATAEMRDLMKKETWMGADEALKRQFVDRVIPAKVGKQSAEALDALAKISCHSETAPNTQGMGLFTTRKELQAQNDAQAKRIDEIADELEASEREIESLRAELATAKEANATFPSDEEIDSLKNEVATLKAAAAAIPDIEALKTERDNAVEAAKPEKIKAAAVALLSAEEADPEVEKIIASRVTEELAKAGHQGAIEDNGDKEVSTKTKTRAEFNALSAADQMAFSKAKGKITD